MTEPAAAPPHQVPGLLRLAADWAWRLLVVLALVYVVARLAARVELALIPLLTAVLLTALLQPVFHGLRRLRLGRGIAATLTVLLAVAVLGGVGAFVADRATADYPQLVDELDNVVVNVQDWLVHGPLHLDRASVSHVGDQLIQYLRGKDGQGRIVTSAVSAGKIAMDVLTALVLTFFLTIFLLYDGRRVFRWLTGFLPTHTRITVDEVGDRMWDTISGYVVGTFTVALFHGAVMGLTLALVGVPLVAPLAVLIFLGGFIPIVGAVVFGGLAVLVTLVSQGPTAALVVLVVLVVENQVEGHVLQPFVVGRHVNLHPMAIAMTLACGALLAGIPGAIFGVPLVAAVNAAAKALRAELPAPEEATL